MNDTIPETRILTALISRLSGIRKTKGYQTDAGLNVQLGYAATGLEDSIQTPAILAQLESLLEKERNGRRAKYQMDFTLSAVTPTHLDATWQLLLISWDLRKALTVTDPLCQEVRKITLGDTGFDIGIANSRLSFADLSLQLDTVFSV